MDMTESYRQSAADISKSNFFDFVTSNEITDAQYKQQMRSVNVFMESPDSRSNPLLSDDPKEQNNNSLLSIVGSQSVSSSVDGTMATATTTLQSFDSIWNVDKERDRLESAMLEDLNKLYWNQDNDVNSTHSGIDQTSNKLISNTDGQIYTLTVLNQEASETNPNRYWCKEEEVSISSPNEMIDQMQQSTLDLESILNIIPNQINGFPPDFSQENSIVKEESFNFDESHHEECNELVSDDMIKVEHFNFDESEYSQGDNKEDLQSPMIITAPLLDAAQIEFNNNNNDWKLADQNGESNESLLRNALQGKTFIRYNPSQKVITNKIDSSVELKRVIINNNNKSDMPSMYRDGKEIISDQSSQLVMTLGPSNGVNIVLFEDPSTTILPDIENPSSTQTVDDILSHLDNCTDDYEKLKRIANEVVESVHQFCTVEQVDQSRSMYNIHHLNGAELVTMVPTQNESQQHLQIVATSPTVSSTKSLSRKYKRSQNKSNASQVSQSQVVSGNTTPIVQTATSTSNGIRKERSLHYCSICSKGFKDKYSVNVHVRTHTGEKPFSCSLCGKSFRQKAHLAKHYQTHIAQKNAASNANIKTNKQR